MKKLMVITVAAVAANLFAGVRLANRFVTLEIGDDGQLNGVPFVGAVNRAGAFVPAVKAVGDDRAIDFTLADGGAVRLLVIPFGDGWMFETRHAALKGAKELRFIRVKPVSDETKLTFVRAATIRTALRDENGLLSAAALSGAGFDQQRAALAIVAKDYEPKILARMALVCGKESMRKEGPWAENLVANPEIAAIPESWRPKKLEGRDFRAGITDLLVGHFGGSLDDLPDCIAFRYAVVSLGCWKIDPRSFVKADYAANPQEQKGAYTIMDVLASSRPAYKEFAKHPDMLFDVQMPVRPLVTLTRDTYGADVEDFNRWRAANRQFIGFRGFSETDNDYSGYRRQVTKLHLEMPAEIQKRYPITADDAADYTNFMQTAWNQMRKVYFGSGEIGGLHSIDMQLGHRIAALGVNMVENEVAINCVSGPWAWSGAFTRGASRQFGCVPRWYMARYLGRKGFSYTRDGQPANGDQRWPRGVRPHFTPYLGGGRSINRRGYFYGWAAGMSTITVEGDCLCFLDDGPNGHCIPTVYCRDFMDIFDLNERVDRGVAYTPVALLGSHYESVSRHAHMEKRKGPYAHSAFLYTLIPINRTDPLCMSERDKGDLGVFWNSRFGEIWDYLTCDSPQEPADFAAVLAHYPVAFLVGWINESTFAAKAVEDYVKGGGTLFVTAENVRKGLVDPALAGVTYGTEKVPFKLGKYDYTALKPSEMATDVTRFDTAFAITNMALFTQRKVGKGKIVTCAVPRYLPDFLLDPQANKIKNVDPWRAVCAGDVDFPLVRELLTKVQGETIPFEVRGNCQWGVNRTAKGWFVWMMNNAGVTKFGGEPEEFDMNETATVTVVSKLTGETKSVTLEPGDTAYLTFE